MNEIIRGLSAEEYHAIDACSCSRLKEFAKSPAHMQAMLRAPKDTDALRIGTAGHYAILQPEEFSAKYLRGIDGDGRTKAVKDAREKLAADNPGAVILKPSEYDCCQQMREAVFRHESASFALSQAGEAELTLLWDHPETGVPCKCRIDALAMELAAAIELKTTKSAAIHAFERDIYNLKYYWQAAFYHDACAQFPELAAVDKHIIIATEKVDPWAVNAFPLRGDAIEAGRSEYERLMPKYAGCLESGEWPLEGDEYSQSFIDISLPPWSWKQIDERIAA